MMKLREWLGRMLLKYAVQKPPVILDGKKKIACVGDSITYGAGVLADRDVSTWEYFLEKMLGTDFQVLNYGISGRTLQQEGDLPYQKEKFWKITHEVRAEVYLLMLGTNDSKPYNWDAERFEQQYRKFVQSYQTLSWNPRVILMAPPCCFEDPQTGVVGYDINGAIIKDIVRETVKKCAEEQNLEWIDLYTFTETHPEWFDDGVHPNKEGNQAIAEEIYRKIARNHAG